jgi:hypothetical protein
MVELPKYVRAVSKSNGRRYLYFEKHRGTAQAWPRIHLPSDPQSEEFWRRLAQCGHLEIGSDGSLKFVDVTDRRHDLPNPDNESEFWSAVDRAEEIGKKLAANDAKTFSALIVEYKNSGAFTAEIAESTRDGYERYLAKIEEIWGNDPVSLLRPVDAQKAIDTYKDIPSAGRSFRATLSRLIAWGIPRGYRDDNPVEKTEKSGDIGTYDPWPPDAFELFFEKAEVDLHLPVYSALFTGQRSVDVMKMRRPALQAQEMPLVAQKTNALIPVQIHSEYRLIIAAACKPDDNVVPLHSDPVMLHLREDGVPWTLGAFKTAWQRQMDQEDFKSFRERRLVYHGLRKNSVCLLLEVGCTEAQVSAIVGMSPVMVAHYSKKVSQFRLARGAMQVFEQGWDDIRGSILGKVKRLK